MHLLWFGTAHLLRTLDAIAKRCAKKFHRTTQHKQDEVKMANDDDIKRLTSTIGWCCFLMLWFFFMSGTFFWWKVCEISNDIKDIRTVIVQQSKECHNIDTVTAKNESENKD
jgi:hypothetical protein